MIYTVSSVNWLKKGDKMKLSSILKKLKLDKSSGKLSRRIIRAFLYLIAIGFISVVLMVSITAVKVGKINSESLYSNIEQSSILYDINGDEIDTLHYNQDRKIVPISEMPDDLKNAFIAIEDKTFYKHHGFNFKRMLGAVLKSITGGSRISGTSTITQQLARNAYLAEIKSQRSIRRKLSEMYIAWRLENNLTKDEILEAYLNTIYLGYGNYGVNAAARTYFSKDVSDLDLAECAALAALPQAPDSYAFITNEAGEGRPEITEIKYYTLDSLGDAVETEEEENTDSADTIEETSYGPLHPVTYVCHLEYFCKACHDDACCYEKPYTCLSPYERIDLIVYGSKCFPEPHKNSSILYFYVGESITLRNCESSDVAEP